MENSRTPYRQKSFLQGLVYYHARRFSFECLVRDFSEEGARLVFGAPVTLPETVELYLPKNNVSHLAQVQWHRGDQVGVAFIRDKTESAPARDDTDAGLTRRAEALEAEIAALRRVINELKVSRRRPQAA